MDDNAPVHRGRTVKYDKDHNEVTSMEWPAKSLDLKRVSMGWWLLRLSAKIVALLRLSVNFFQLRLTTKFKINFFCFKKLNIN